MTAAATANRTVSAKPEIVRQYRPIGCAAILAALMYVGAKR